jgi:hypothetical protein
VRLYSESGHVCDATIADVQGVKRFDPHFYQVDVWSGAIDNEPQRSEAEIAREIWSMSEGALWGRLVPAPGQSCDGARWARDASLPKPTLWANDAAVASAMKPTIERTFKKLPGWTAQQTEFKADGGSGDWSEDISIVAFTDRAAGATFVAASTYGGEGCGGFYGELWAVWEVTAGGTLTLRTDGEEPGAVFYPLSAFDTDGDQVPELFGKLHPWLVPGTMMMELRDGTYAVTDDIQLISYNCPC